MYAYKIIKLKVLLYLLLFHYLLLGKFIIVMNLIILTHLIFLLKKITTSNKYPAVIQSGGLVLDANTLDVFSISSITVLSFKHKTKFKIII